MTCGQGRSKQQESDMNKSLVVAVVGATGAVGREMLSTLAARNFPASKIVALASARSAGKKVPFGDSGEELTVQELTKDSFEVSIWPSSPLAAALPPPSPPTPSRPAAWWSTTPARGAWTSAARWWCPK